MTTRRPIPIQIINLIQSFSEEKDIYIKDNYLSSLMDIKDAIDDVLRKNKKIK